MSFLLSHPAIESPSTFAALVTAWAIASGTRVWSSTSGMMRFYALCIIQSQADQKCPQNTYFFLLH
jgi:hypothetical protein